MSRYTITSIISAIVILVMVLQVQEGTLNPWWLAAPLTIYSLFLVVGSIKISYNFYFKSYCKGVTAEKVIALTYDDGPNEQVTGKLLEILENYHAPAAFFCIGKHLNSGGSLIRETANRGHLIGNHSYSHHRWFDLFTSKKMTAEIMATNKEIERKTGKTPLLFRPPYGVTNPMLKKAVDATGMISIGWSLRSFDTVKSETAVLKKLKARTRPGDVILMHDSDPKVVGITKEYLEWLMDNDYKVVSLTDLFNINAYVSE
jgi:peptidoglycan/xylan/chitin deacetylase (PgdA/CDA1 family)